jgi:hypothetical protein
VGGGLLLHGEQEQVHMGSIAHRMNCGDGYALFRKQEGSKGGATEDSVPSRAKAHDAPDPV